MCHSLYTGNKAALKAYAFLLTVVRFEGTM